MNQNIHDLIIVGAGPAGLSAAINGASEGLNVLVLETENKVGGQAKHSSRIENYAGFPSGVTGPQLMSRLHTQAKKFGAQFEYGATVTRLALEGKFRTVELSSGRTVVGYTVLLASGLQWREFEAPGAAEYLGRGVYYGLDMNMAHIYNGQHVAVVGGANSAGQAALWLARFAESVALVVRASSLSQMSEYLSARVLKLPNVHVSYDSQITAIGGNDTKVTSVTLFPPEGGEIVPMSGVFIFIGATPHTAWLNGVCKLDEHGFVIAKNYATSCRGLFAVGDVRSGSVKRIAASSGEGSAVIPRIHEYLIDLKARHS